MGPGGDEETGLANAVRFEFLDDDAVEERAKVVAHGLRKTLVRGVGRAW
jgi:hypothetical protein